MSSQVQQTIKQGTREVLLVMASNSLAGFSVARAALQSRNFSAVLCGVVSTINSNSEKSRYLQGLGGKLVDVRVDNEQTLVDAMSVATVVFGETDYWRLVEFYDGDINKAKDAEVEQVRVMMKAAYQSNIRQFIYASVPHVRKLYHDSIVVFTNEKTPMEEVVEKSGVNYTIVRFSALHHNFGARMQAEESSGKFTLQMKMEKLYTTNVDDFSGGIVYVMNNPTEFLNKSLEFVSDVSNQPTGIGGFRA